MAGYMVLGMGFGILLHNAGYGVLWAFAMSLFIYAGSMQYVGVGLIAGGASVLTAALTTFMVNARHLFYSISMVGRYKEAGRYKPYLIFALTDETYSLLCDGNGPEDIHRYRFFVSLFDQCYWITGSVVGSLIGAVLPFSTAGIEFSMTALFIVIVVSQWENNSDHLIVVLSFIISIVCLIIFGSSDFLLPAMIMIIVMLDILKRIRGSKDA
jgi:4-azaleucine resistance transporter AzlC